MIHSKKLSKFKEIVHGFTTRREGDFRLSSLRQNSAIAKFCQQIGKLVLMKQEHTDKIKIVKSANLKKEITVFEEFDGLITSAKGVFLGVRTADCCPILFYEPVAKIIGVAHAGWRGSRLRISSKMVGEIGKIGGIRANIVCVIGPHICAKCYDIPQERRGFFEKKHVKEKYLNLNSVNTDQFLEAGIKKENIEILPYCTYHQNEDFFSYRKNKKSEDYGEMLAYIGLDDG